MTTRATVYLHPKVYRAIKVKAAQSDRTISDVVNESLTLSLKEDEIDLEAYAKRAKEPRRSYEEVLKDLKKDGLL
jgi:hypothetical protein